MLRLIWGFSGRTYHIAGNPMPRLNYFLQIGVIGQHDFGLSPPVKYFTDRSKAVLLLWIFYVFALSCVCYVFVRVCLYVLCGHLLGKSWPLGSRLWCPIWVCHFPIGILGQVWYLIVSIPDLCPLSYLSSHCLSNGHSHQILLSTLFVKLHLLKINLWLLHVDLNLNMICHLMFHLWCLNGTKKSTWVWSGNTTITHHRSTQDTVRERSGSVVKCLTRDRRAAGSSLTGVTALCPWARTLILA